MNKNWSGLFSLSLQSVEWQVKNLFQDVGGEKVVELMDRLAGIPDQERKKLLESFLTQVSLHVTTEPLKLSSEESELRKIEDQLVNDVSREISKSGRLSVVHGGKSPNSAKLFDFELAKKERENRCETSISQH